MSVRTNTKNNIKNKKECRQVYSSWERLGSLLRVVLRLVLQELQVERIALVVRRRSGQGQDNEGPVSCVVAGAVVAAPRGGVRRLGHVFNFPVPE